MSAITIVKDQLSLDASNRKLSLDIKSDLNEESVFHMLSILHPIISKQLDVAKKWMLIDAIKELATGEEDTSFLSAEYKEVLKDEAMIRQRRCCKDKRKTEYHRFIEAVKTPADQLPIRFFKRILQANVI